MSRKVSRAGVILGLLLFTSGAVSADILSSLLKGGGIAFLISRFGGQINSAINKVTHTPNNTSQFATKVVPIISVGDGREVGAVQIMGPNSAVKKVQAVAQIESKFSPLGMRFRGLIPVATKHITSIKRIPGVGISGLLDFKI